MGQDGDLDQTDGGAATLGAGKSNQTKKEPPPDLAPGAGLLQSASSELASLGGYRPSSLPHSTRSPLWQPSPANHLMPMSESA